MTAASNSEATRYVVENGWLAEVVDGHTCGTRPGGHFGAHEPGCGLVPVARIDDLLAAHAAQATQAPLSQPIPAPVDSGAIDWSVGIVAQTVAGEVVLRMTEEQAAQLRDGLNWLTGDDEMTGYDDE